MELHNKGIPSDELIQRGVPAQLVNRVMKALSKPVPVADGQSVATTSSSPLLSARPASLPPKPVAALPPKPTTTSMVGLDATHLEVDHDADVDMDIDDSEHEKSPQMASEAPFMSSVPGFVQFNSGFRKLFPLAFSRLTPCLLFRGPARLQFPQCTSCLCTSRYRLFKIRCPYST